MIEYSSRKLHTLKRCESSLAINSKAACKRPGPPPPAPPSYIGAHCGSCADSNPPLTIPWQATHEACTSATATHSTHPHHPQETRGQHPPPESPGSRRNPEARPHRSVRAACAAHHPPHPVGWVHASRWRDAEGGNGSVHHVAPSTQSQRHGREQGHAGCASFYWLAVIWGAPSSQHFGS